MHPANAVYYEKSRKDRRSPLKKVLDTVDAADLQNVIACPYGCTGADQDRFGYCSHLIGFVENHLLPEGEIMPKQVKLCEGVVVDLVAKEPDEHNRRPVVGKGELKVGDHLMRIVSSMRVYRRSAEAKPQKTGSEAA